MPTSKLQKLTGKELRHRFHRYNVIENSRPPWLASITGGRLELDFYIERLNIAVEVQGKQHTNFVPRFHKTEMDFINQIKRDEEKARLCKQRGVTLLYVYCKKDIEKAIAEIQVLIGDIVFCRRKTSRKNVMKILPTLFQERRGKHNKTTLRKAKRCLRLIVNTSQTMLHKGKPLTKQRYRNLVGALTTLSLHIGHIKIPSDQISLIEFAIAQVLKHEAHLESVPKPLPYPRKQT